MIATHFGIRTHHRVPVATPVYFSNEAVDGAGHLWNLSLSGCRVDGSVSVRTGTRLTLLVLLPGTQAFLVIREAQVVWSRGQEFGLRLINLHAPEAARLDTFVRNQIA